jgi:hypothetical protein
MGIFNHSEDKTPPAASAESTAGKPAAPGGVLPQLAAAREKLMAKDLPAAMAIYEQVLAGIAGERSDVLMTISADLGTNGHVFQIIELLAPRYEVEKHGAPAGFNLLQAYLATRQAEAAQHLLDLLYSLHRPDLEARLHGFSNAVSELFIRESEAAQVVGEVDEKVSLVSISKPIWFYGLENVAPHLLPDKNGKLRRVAFAQCAVLGLDNVLEVSARPEEGLGRLSRGLALWLADTFAFSAGYDAMAAIGTAGQHYMLFPTEWTSENIRQLNDTTDKGLDYVVTGALRNRNDDFELTLRIWEVKKSRELKAFTARWTPSSADAELTRLLGQMRGYMEWVALPAGRGLAYVPPAAPLAYLHGLGTALTFFLGGKGVIAAGQMPPDGAGLLRAARANPDHVASQLALAAWLLQRKATGQPLDVEAHQHTCAWLSSEKAQAADVAALVVKLA